LISLIKFSIPESVNAWIDIKQRGLEIAPDLAVGDGALGFWKAIEQGLSEHQASAVLANGVAEIP
jgi:hypothetical protein